MCTDGSYPYVWAAVFHFNISNAELSFKSLIHRSTYSVQAYSKTNDLSLEHNSILEHTNLVNFNIYHISILQETLWLHEITDP